MGRQKDLRRCIQRMYAVSVAERIESHVTLVTEQR